MQLIGHDYWNNNKLLSSFLSQSLLGSLFCIQWLRMLPAKLHVLYVCLEQVRVICPLVYSSLFIMVQSWPRDTRSPLSELSERGFSPSSQSPENYSSLNTAFQWRWSPRATGIRVARSRLWWNRSTRTFVVSWTQQDPPAPRWWEAKRMEDKYPCICKDDSIHSLFSPEISCLQRVVSSERLLSKLKTARMKSIKPQPFSVSQFHLLIISISETTTCHICGRDMHVINHTCAL